jgi:hypothetical protein
MNLVRQILFKVDDHAGGFAPQHLEIDGFTSDQVGYHVWLLDDAGLIEAATVTAHGSSSPQAIPLHLTWEGHDFVAAARSDTAWSRAMQKAKSVGGPLTFAVLKQLLESMMKSQLGL